MARAWVCTGLNNKMIQKILDIKKLFQRHKSESDIFDPTVHGTRCILHVTNLALFGVVITLTIASTLIYYLMPITDISELSRAIDDKGLVTDINKESTNTESLDSDSKKEIVIESKTFNVINERNVFSHKRKEWLVKAVIPKSSELKNRNRSRDDLAKRALAKKKAQAGKPKKIILHGVVIAGDVKKALINNPLKGVSKNKTLYVEEGDKLEGYTVTSIENDRIRLDWHGEEIVITLYSGLKEFKRGGNSGRAKTGGITKLEYNFKVVEDVQAEKGLESKKVANAVTFDDALLNFAYKKPECFSMPDFDSALSSVAVGMQDVAETFPDIESNDVGTSKEELDGVTRLEYEFKVIDDSPAKGNLDVGDTEVKNVVHADMLDEPSLKLVYKESVSFSMPVFEDSPLSEVVKMKEVAEVFPGMESNSSALSVEKQDPVEFEATRSVALMSKKGSKQEAFSGGPSEILLHGIVIVTSRDIKKALVNIPMSPFRKERTLYVEEGDAFEGYEVTSIEPDRLMLEWNGKEMIVKFPLL